MSKTLNLIDILLTTGRHLFMMGRFTEALEPLTKLCGFRRLPERVNEELQTLLAEIFFQQKKYKDARRHLTAAIALRPLKAEYCYLMAVAIEEDEGADRNRAEMYYVRAIELDASEPTYFADYGSYLFTIDKKKEALQAIRKAYTLGVADAAMVAQVAQVLRREGYSEEATTKVRAALFHNHGAAPFRRLWQEHQFALIHAKQQSSPTRDRADAERAVILPFIPAEQQHGRFVELGEKTIRIDQAQSLNEPRKQAPATGGGFRRPPKKG